MAAAQPDPRTRHYGVFYGLDEPTGDGPVALVIGNCQAESLRLMLDGGELRTVRLPPVHELVADDLPHLARWLARTTLLITQPIRDDYRGLPLGSAQLREPLGRGALTVRVPVIRFAGLYPAHAIVRPPSDPSLVPPVVAYHDLRFLAQAAGLRLSPLQVPAVRAIAEHSLEQLRSREVAHGTVIVSDLFAAPSFALMRTLNHPGNPVWAVLAARVRAALGLSEHVVDPGRPLLDSVHAPREAAVLEAWEIDDQERPHWVVGGNVVETEAVREEHLIWYERHPDAVQAGLNRHADALRLLGAA
ncbi:WcbI family polysaccharide biosynthesis putative acetyltransferase [Actinoplanes sp. TRM 88003]|uniref:WcbI family polysaccharide biosynthesis putative acetyltransferase n=1 Tax=Paractinoplanes aksuensis TaxID=2939490 RepID=A0ABT1DLC1_9ACTN|nr:WcbI family polysaccharide biosynthesis putative acetyltransferase [Actinoplanes aksuensis]MCO8271627.1 WcbI family polysaccharide biosynthesis putative acetyltransferase [Actinoplanes aksuensis]